MDEKTEDRVEEGKKIAFYQVCLDAWVNTRMERDKTLLGLSAGGVALLVTLLTTVGVDSVHSFALYLLSLSLFIATILICVLILDKNADYLKKVIKEGETGHSNTLRRLDSWALSLFVMGVITSALIALSVAGEGVLSKESNSMAEETKKEELVVPQEHIKKESLDGIGGLGPGRAEKTPPPQSETPAQNSGQQQPSTDTSSKDNSGKK